MTKVLTLKFGNEIHEIHMLNVGEIFPDFGGSKRGLCVGENQPEGEKTASMIYRMRTPMSTEDTEHDISDKIFWAWIARMIAGAERHKPDEVIAKVL